MKQLKDIIIEKLIINKNVAKSDFIQSINWNTLDDEVKELKSIIAKCSIIKYMDIYYHMEIFQHDYTKDKHDNTKDIVKLIKKKYSDESDDIYVICWFNAVKLQWNDAILELADYLNDNNIYKLEQLHKLIISIYLKSSSSNNSRYMNYFNLYNIPTDFDK